MSGIDQAFVKAYARRQLASQRPSANALPAAPINDSVMVDRSVADTVSVWIDSGSETTLRIDPAHGFSRQPEPKDHSATTGYDQPPKRESEQSAIPEATRVAHSPTSAPADSPAPPSPTPLSPAPPMATMPHVYTAYAITEGDSSWIEMLRCEGHAASTLDVHENFYVRDTPDIHRASTVKQSPEAVVIAEEPPIAETHESHESHETAEAPPALPSTAEVRGTSHRVDSTDAVEPAPQSRREFHAKWEIDTLDIPTVVADLFFDGELFQQIAQQLADAADTGMRRLLVTSVHDGEGRSTVAIGLAIAAAASGKRVALIDADATSPTLVDDLRLEIEFGWTEAIRGRLPLEEICVHATHDGVTLVPLMTPHGATAATPHETRELIEKLEESFDLLIVDGGSSQCAATAGTLGKYDSAMIVFNKTRTATVDINEYSFQLRRSGVSGVGVVENFVS